MFGERLFHRAGEGSWYEYDEDVVARFPTRQPVTVRRDR
jgi:hypothetical protein